MGWLTFGLGIIRPRVHALPLQNTMTTPTLPACSITLLFALSTASCVVPGSDTSGGTTQGPLPTTGVTTTGTEDTSADTSSASTTGQSTEGPGDSTGMGSSTGEDAAAGFCREICRADEDCLIAGVDEGYVCSDGRCLPGDLPGPCSDDLYCQIVGASGLAFCQASRECSLGRVCAELGGSAVGVCIYPTDEMGQCPTNLEPAAVPLFEGGETEACIDPDFACDPITGNRLIFNCIIDDPCRSDADCNLDPSRPVCANDGSCICTDDAHCAAVPGHPSCIDGRCACAGDADCAGLPGLDACVDGYCGCASDASCDGETVFDGTANACEPA